MNLDLAMKCLAKLRNAQMNLMSVVRGLVKVVGKRIVNLRKPRRSIFNHIFKFVRLQ